MTYEQFYDTFARRCYGDEHAVEMAQLHMRLEALGPRWTGSRGQVECGGFQWFSDDARPKAENLAALREIDDRLAAVEADCQTGPARRHLERLGYLRATIRFLSLFDDAALKLAPGGSTEALITQAEQAQQAGNAAEAERLATQAIEELSKTTLADAMQAYRSRLTTQGDFGNLATINVKAYAAFLGLWERAEAVLGKDVPPPGPPPETGPPTLVVKAPASALLGAGRSLDSFAKVSAAAPTVQVTLRTRWRDGRWLPWPLKPLRDGCTYPFTVMLPPSALLPTEFYVEAVDEQGRAATAPAGAPENVFSFSRLPDWEPVVYGPVLYRGQALAPWGESATPEPAALVWTVVQAQAYQPCEAEANAGEAEATLPCRYHWAAWVLPDELLGLPEITARCAVWRRDAAITYSNVAGLPTHGPPVRFARPDPPASPASARSEIAGPYLARVSWDAVAEAATYELHRSAEPNFTPSEQTRIAEWPWTVYDDVGLRSNTTYEWAVVAVNDAGMRSPFTRTPELYIPDQPPAEPPTGLVATAGPGRVTLAWQPSPERVSGYAVFMRPEAAGDWQRISGDAPLKGTSYVVGGLPDTEPRRFVVAAIDRGGRQGERAEPVSASAKAIPVEPVLSIAFDSAAAETGQQGTLGGKATIHDGVLDTREGGWVAFPKEENLQLAGPLSLEFRINVDQVKGIPVMVSFGHYEGLGYWMQLIGGSVRWYLPVMKILDAGSTPGPGWHHLCGTYDGRFSRLYIDGQAVGSRDVGQVDLAPWPGEFRIGIYSETDEQFQTHAQFDDVKVYQRALSAEEVAAAASR
ncbi:MAG: hypothetical protein FJX74_00355 [Armatimonadetes bacterium]|nr:hypothetical protein [Armatimonadota bacterium]